MTFQQGQLRLKVKNETSSDKSGQFAPRKEPGAGSRPGQYCPEDRTGGGPRPASLLLLQGSTFLLSPSHLLSLGGPAVLSLSHTHPLPPLHAVRTLPTKGPSLARPRAGVRTAAPGFQNA